MRFVVRGALLLGCAEILPLTRRYFGFGFCLGMALVYAIKQQLLVYLPVPVHYQALNGYAALALAIHFLGRFFSPRMFVRHAGISGGYPGLPWLCYVGMSERAARRYGEPLLALLVAVLVADSPVSLRFQPGYTQHSCRI